MIYVYAVKDMVVVVNVVALDLISIFSFPYNSSEAVQWEIRKQIKMDMYLYIWIRILLLQLY